MLFSTLDFPFFRKQNSNVSNFRTSRPLHGAISNTSRKILFLVEFWRNWRLSGVSVFGPAASWPCSGLVTRQEHCTAMYFKCWDLYCTYSALQTFLQCCPLNTAQRSTGRPALSYYGFIDDSITGLTSLIPFPTFPICHQPYYWLTWCCEWKKFETSSTINWQ